MLDVQDRIQKVQTEIQESERTANEASDKRSMFEKEARQARKRAEELRSELIGLYQKQSMEKPPQAKK